MNRITAETRSNQNGTGQVRLLNHFLGEDRENFRNQVVKILKRFSFSIGSHGDHVLVCGVRCKIEVSINLPTSFGSY
jgi:hypothetical protein